MSDETFAYAARLGNLAHGFFPDSVFELSGKPLPHPWLPLSLTAPLTHLVGLDITWLILHAFLPALCILLMARLLEPLVSSRQMAFCIAFLSLTLALSPRNFLFFSAPTQPLELTRFPNPCFSLALLLASLLSLRRALETCRWRPLLSSGVMSGLLFHSYYFSAWAMFFALTLLLCSFLLQGDWRRGRLCGVAILLALIIASPYLLVWQVEKQALAGTYLIRMGTLSTAPHWQGILIALTAFVLLAVQGSFAKKTETPAVFLALLGGVGVAINLQMFTGLDAQHVSHFSHHLIQPFAFAFLAALVSRTPFFERSVVSVAIIIGALAVIRQTICATRTAHLHINDSTREAALSQLASKSAVVGMLDRELIDLFPLRSKGWSFVPNPMMTRATNPEIMTRYYILSQIAGRDWKEVSQMLAGKGFISSGGESEVFHLLRLPSIDEEAIQNAKMFWDRIQFPDCFRKRRLDYLILRRGLSPTKIAVEKVNEKLRLDRLENTMKNPKIERSRSSGVTLIEITVGIALHRPYPLGWRVNF